jgi:hypothetical protein
LATLKEEAIAFALKKTIAVFDSGKKNRLNLHASSLLGHRITSRRRSGWPGAAASGDAMK